MVIYTFVKIAATLLMLGIIIGIISSLIAIILGMASLALLLLKIGISIAGLAVIAIVILWLIYEVWM